MARLDPPFAAQPHTFHTAEPPPSYRLDVPGRWDVYDTANMMDNETLERYRERGYMAAVHWHSQDVQEAYAKNGPKAAHKAPGAPRGRPLVHPVVEGESTEQRARRLARERVQRHAANKKLPRHTLTLPQARALMVWAYERSPVEFTDEVVLQALQHAANTPSA